MLTAIFIFELGSLICGVATSSNALIAGRAIAGVGCAGIASGAYIIIGHVFPLRIRPIYISSIAMVFAVAAVLGPVLGGIFTTHLTWRWCFYINLPFGGFTMAALLFFLPPLELFGVLGIAFVAFEYWKGAEATLPMHIITQRSVAAAAWSAFCNRGSFFLLIYYIPFWQQVIRNASAASSGISLLPFVLGVAVMANVVGFLVMKFGYCRSYRLESLYMEPSQLIVQKLRCPLHTTPFRHYDH
jgi:MFS family permease